VPPPVRGLRDFSRFASLVSYLAGLAAGGLISAALLTALGALWAFSASQVALILLVLALFRFVRPKTVAVGGYKVPRDWERWGPSRYLGVFGLFLGLGFVTTMPSPVMIGLLAWTWHLRNLGLAIVTFMAFAFGRSLPSLKVYLASRREEDVKEAADAMARRVPVVGLAEAGVATALALVLLSAAV
jgi:hypothetical protein